MWDIRRRKPHCRHNDLRPERDEEWFDIDVASMTAAVDVWIDWMKYRGPWNREGYLKRPELRKPKA